jgi:hypothetical protein
MDSTSKSFTVTRQRHNLRYEDVKEVDLFLQQSYIDKTISTITKTSEQEYIFEQLQQEQFDLHTQLQQRKRTASASSASTSPNLSRTSSPLQTPLIGSPILSPSKCPVCNLYTSTETVVTWKECGHSKMIVGGSSALPGALPPPLSLPPPVHTSPVQSIQQSSFKTSFLPKIGGKFMP